MDWKFVALFEVPADFGAEDSFQSVIRELINAQNVKMPQKTSGNLKSHNIRKFICTSIFEREFLVFVFSKNIYF